MDLIKYLKSKLFYILTPALICMLSAIFFADSVRAENFSGFFFRSEAGLFFVRYKSKIYNLQSNNIENQKGLNKLSSGDYVSFEGALDPNTNKITVSSIDFVGLRKILGRWKSENNFIYSIKSFSSIEVLSPDLATEFTGKYILTPETDGWGVLVNGSTKESKAAYEGQLFINSDDVLKLELYDNSSGKKIDTIILKKD